jgi:hypothetical protein
MERGVGRVGSSLTGRKVEIEPIDQEGHSRSHGDVPGKENPTGRDPWGPGEARRTARGGMRRRSRARSAKSSDASEALRLPPQSPDRIELSFMASSRWSGRVCPSGTKVPRGNGRLNSPRGHATPPQGPTAPPAWQKVAA